MKGLPGRHMGSKELGEPLVYVPSHSARDIDEDLGLAGILKRTEEGKLETHGVASWRRRESNPRPGSKEKSDGTRLPLPELDSQPFPLPLRVL